jgi:hypothetical protein
VRRLSLSPGVALFVIVLTLATGTAWAKPKKVVDLCQVSHPSDAAIAWECRPLKWGDSPLKLFGNHWREVLRFNRIDQRHFKAGVSIKVPLDLAGLADFTPLPREYPEAAGEEKFILVDLAEQYLGAYERGQLRYAFPIATGGPENPTPTGDFKVSAFDQDHDSSLYKIDKTDIPYPMHYALRFYTSPEWVAFWMHGRDIPGYPASHGCIGLYDEEMQKRYYKNPSKPVFQDATTLYKWAIGSHPDRGKITSLKNGPRVKIIGAIPQVASH